ncbi:MAG: gluconate 2-dehydrogenase subunit 3 family protein [Bryobacterales bacterium]|nr:gluconate 2-dehydrogenase subunit 3 family protein [Bryobacterales bacterium]
MERREAIQLVVIGSSAAAAPAQEHQHSAAAPASVLAKFFTEPQRKLVDELAEMIIPADGHSPGAREAGVTAFIEDVAHTEQAAWTEGLAAVDAAAQARFGAPFLACTNAQRHELMKAWAAAEAKPYTPAEQFFVRIKRQTISGYYTSSVGLLKDLQYKGIVPLVQYPACQHPEHKEAK